MFRMIYEGHSEKDYGGFPQASYEVDEGEATIYDYAHAFGHMLMFMGFTQRQVEDIFTTDWETICDKHYNIY